MQTMTSDLNARFHALFQQKTLFKSLLDARRQWGKGYEIVLDSEGKALTYEDLITRCYALGHKIQQVTGKREHVGILLPNSLAIVVCFFALQAYERIPCLLNFSAGSQAIVSACETTQVRMIYSSKAFIASAKLEALIQTLKQHSFKIIYLEDLVKGIHFFNKLSAKLKSKLANFFYPQTHSRQEAVILFTSGSEGAPKGVALSHFNIQANRAQILAVLNLDPHTDILLNVLPLFHSFGLSALLLASLSGIKTVLHPSPLHYQRIPQLIYQSHATIFFATDTFLQGYAHYAKAAELKSLRLVFAGAEKLKESTRQLWKNKFNLEILEGYGTTETAPILSLNTPEAHKPGTVGHLLPGLDFELLPMEGIEGGRLKISGPNVMLGYYQAKNPGVLEPAHSQHDTGDIVNIDNEGFIYITGRAKRFAKIAGEMISLQAVEQFINELWPEAHHAVLNTPHPKHGEALILFTNYPRARRENILQAAQARGMTELVCPKKIILLENMPLLASGKIDYAKLEQLVLNSIAEVKNGVSALNELSV